MSCNSSTMLSPLDQYTAVGVWLGRRASISSTLGSAPRTITSTSISPLRPRPAARRRAAALKAASVPGATAWAHAVAPGTLAAFNAAALRLAAGLGLNGLMDVEVMVRGAEPKVLEIDARLPSQTPTAVYWSSGLNSVELLHDMARRGAPRRAMSCNSSTMLSPLDQYTAVGVWLGRRASISSTLGSAPRTITSTSISPLRPRPAARRRAAALKAASVPGATAWAHAHEPPGPAAEGPPASASPTGATTRLQS